MTFRKSKSLNMVTSLDEAAENFSAILKKHKISASEYTTLRDILKRAPTFAELGVFSAMWSEHCSYKSSRVHLGRFPTTGPQVVVGPGENAGVVELEDQLCLVFKMESHNHPSYIEPYQGAATGVGGILRDVFCMGARPVANLNCLRFGEKSHPRTAHLFAQAVKGIGDYGNCVGIPTVGGNISFDASYNGNCLVNAMTVGVIDKNKIFKGFATGLGNLVVYVGSATGRDGIHGATMASDSFDSSRNEERGTIQVGDPFTEKLLIEATLEVLEKGLVVGLQDMGAAGLTSASVEMAERAGNGLWINLDEVPARAQNLTAYEMLLSESQERMLMVIEPSRWDELKVVLDRWELHSAIIGEVTDTGRFQCCHQGRIEVDIPVLPLTQKAPRYERPLKERVETNLVQNWTETLQDAIEKKYGKNSEDLLKAVLNEVGDKSLVYQQYDHHIGAKTVLGPEDGGAAVLWLRTDIPHKSPYVGFSVSTAGLERYCENNPKKGAALSVLHAANEIIARGGTPLAATDCLNYGNPERPELMWEFSQGVDGISEACKALNTPVVSGNVSLYNESNGKNIYSTPMIGVVGKIADVRTVPSARLSHEKSAVKLYAILPKSSASFGASWLTKSLGLDARFALVPELSWPAILEAQEFLKKSVNNIGCSAARHIGQGGIATTLIKMFSGQEFSGALKIRNDHDDKMWWQKWLGEYAAGFLVAIREDDTKKIQAWKEATKQFKFNRFEELGVLEQKNGTLTFDDQSIHLDVIYSSLSLAYPISR
jgi:phosphoribosylformylglycinamidine synthase II